MPAVKMTVAQRRFLLPAFALAVLLAFLISTRYSNTGTKLQEIINDHVPSLTTESPETSVDADGNTQTPSSSSVSNANKDPRPQDGGVGTHLHVKPVAETLPGAGMRGCEYPILIHVTPDEHCTGALALYSSIVRNVLLDADHLAGKTCVHFTYVDPEITSIEKMYTWASKANPYTAVADCALLSNLPAFNALVPIRFQALAPIEEPVFMETRPHWLAALNKVHSWAFDLYPRILLLDADSIIVTELHNIFDESDPFVTIAGGVDQYPSCHDRSRINGGMILLRPSRYFHIVATELLHDPKASCLTGKWQQSEQELLNCICGYTYGDKQVRPLRNEFRCEIMPMYNSVWPRNYACSDANVRDIRSIHFTASPKPWLVEEEDLEKRFDTGFWMCVRDAGRKDDDRAVVKCAVPGREETRLVGLGGAFAV
jgi:hypothetical protein